MRKIYLFFERAIFLLLVIIFAGVSYKLTGQVVVQTYSYSGSIVNFTVPTCVTVLTIQAKGAQGGYHPSSTVASGLGASITGVVTVSSGQVLKILVGQMPGNPDGNGGGGGSFVTDLANNPLVIAGGGGGSSQGVDSPDKNGQTGTSGGLGAGGGGTGGINGNGGNIGATFAAGAGGGLLTNGAAGWTANTGGIAFVNGGSGSSQTALGGFGGGGSGSLYVVGGGGGGYSGGGSGSNSQGAGVGGGGGSYNAGINQTNVSGANTGNGLVTIWYNTGGSGAVATLSPSVGICPGGSATLTASGNVLTYTWSTNSGAQSIVVTPNATTTYTLFGTNATGCVSSSVLTVTVHPLPSISVISSKSLICVGDTALLTASGADTYTWSGGPSTASFVITPLTNVSTTYSVAATSTAGCGNTGIITPVVDPLVLSTSGNTVVCLGKSALLMASGANVGSYSWLNNTTGNAIPFQSTSVSPTILTVYTASGVNANNCTVTQTVSVGVNPNPVVTAQASKTLACKGETINLSASGASTYSWTNIGATASVTVAPPLNIIYVYTVTGTDANGCSATTNISVKVELCTGLAVLTRLYSKTKIYPNPSDGLFYIESPSTINNGSIKIYNTLGNLIRSYEDLSGVTTIDINNEADGIYFVYVFEGNQRISFTKIIKQ